MQEDKYSKNTPMKFFIKTVLVVICSVAALYCNAQKKAIFKPKIVYKTANLVITQISENAFEHTSYLQTDDFGNVPCNGLVVRNSGETIVFDTPTKDESADELIRWVKRKLNCKINAIVPTHFHNDCLGGLRSFHKAGVPSYAYFKTIEFATAEKSVLPENSFRDSLSLKVGTEFVIVKFFGEGHTRDNVVGYFPSEHIMFGGCLVKELGASKGYLGDANVAAWPQTIANVKKAYPDVKIIIPGHGARGDQQLLDYTKKLFDEDGK